MTVYLLKFEKEHLDFLDSQTFMIPSFSQALTFSLYYKDFGLITIHFISTIVIHRLL